MGYASFLGGSSWDVVYGSAVDSQGAVYLVGRTASADFPVTSGAFDTSIAEVDVFVVKVAPDGSRLEYATLIGGSGTDSGYAIAVQDGIAYITGETTSTDFPMGGSLSGGSDAFIAAVNRDGSELVFDTRLGGSDAEAGYGIAVQGDLIVATGNTWSSDLAGYKASGDAFLARLDASGSLDSLTLMGGSDADVGYAVALRDGAICLAGQTFSSNLLAPRLGYAGNGDAFLARFSLDGQLMNGAYLGGAQDDRGYAAAIDADGNCLIAGVTASADFPSTLGAYAAGQEAFLAQLSSQGAVTAAAIFGGKGDDEARGLVLDGVGGAWLAGSTSSPDFPVTVPALQGTYRGGSDLFLARLDLAQIPFLTEATFLGGRQDELAYSLAYTPAGALYLGGYSKSGDFPVQAALDASLAGSQDGFVARLNLSSPAQPTATTAVGATPGSSPTLAPTTTQRSGGTRPPATLASTSVPAGALSGTMGAAITASVTPLGSPSGELTTQEAGAATAPLATDTPSVVALAQPSTQAGATTASTAPTNEGGAPSQAAAEAGNQELSPVFLIAALVAVLVLGLRSVAKWLRRKA